MSRFYFGGSDSESGDEDALPYPQPLARSAFLTSDFSPTAFLSSLQNRHQTLEDLRTELRTRSQELNKELLDLVNENYQDFLGLGSSLTGGDEKIEEVRVGLLSFRRDVDGLRAKVTERRQEVETLLDEKRTVASQIRRARGLLEIDTRLEELEQALAITHMAQDGDQDDDSITISESEESEDGAVGGTVSIAKLRQRAHQFVTVKRLITKLGSDHPFLVGQEARLKEVRETLLMDMNSALAERKRVGSEGASLKVLTLYRILDEPHAAVTTLKESK